MAKTEDRHVRKHQVLSHGQSAMVRNIDRAVIIKNEEIFLVCRPDGWVPEERDQGFGLYYHDTRYLNGYELRLNGQLPDALGAVADEGFIAKVQLTNPQLETDGETVPKRKIGVRWERILSGEDIALYDTIECHNYGREIASLKISLAFQASFEDVYAVRGLLPEHPGKLHQPRWVDGDLKFFYEGTDGWNRSTVVRTSPPPDEVQETTANFQVTIPPRQSTKLAVSVTLAEFKKDEKEPHAGPHRSIEEVACTRQHMAEDWMKLHAEVQSDSPLLDRVVRQSVRDLQLLRTPLNDEEYFAAGLPWFAALFGRDSLIASIQMLAFHPQMAEKTLRLLARWQGSEHDAWRDEEPGKILHEYRMGELARAGRLPHSPYYGTVDAPLLFLILIGLHADWTGNLSLFRDLEQHIDAALSWADARIDANDGYIAYDSKSDQGLVNQGWKDSGDGIVNGQGEIAHPPISLVEVQAYLYMAWRSIAGLFRRTGKTGKADNLERCADRLRERFNRDFWLGDLGTYAMGLEADAKPLRVISSNAGHALWAGIADEAKASTMVRRLLQEDSFSGWGVRTLAASERAYDPVGYHVGTVWPHDNSILVGGLRRYGRDEEALRIFGGMLDAAAGFEHFRLPEAFSGFSRREYSTPVRYPVACHPQAWASGAVPYMLQQILGLQCDAFEKRLRIVRPRLPEFIGRLQLFGVNVGSGSVDLRFERRRNGLTADVTRADGDIDVEFVMPKDA